MDTVFYFISFLSGMVYGFIQLIVPHRRMKKEALKNIWSIIYIFGNAFSSLLVFIFLKSSNLISIDISHDANMKMILLSISSGPLIGFALKHIGNKSGGDSGSFRSFHEKSMKFIIEEIQHSVDVKRVDLSREVAMMFRGNCEELYKVAVDYLEITTESESQKSKDMKYLNDLKNRDSGHLLARYLIESYGSEWVKKRFIYNSQEKNTKRRWITWIKRKFLPSKDFIDGNVPGTTNP